MAHSESRASATREFQLAVFTGGIYGATHTISGHPLDTVKTRMQLDPAYRNLGAFSTAGKLFRDQGIRGFMRGCIPPLYGSTLYRSAMMSVYEATYTYLDKRGDFSQEYFVFRPLVFIGACAASWGRAVVESPIEYAKLMGQKGEKWRLKDIYRGAGWQVARTTVLLIPIFTIIDNCRRKTTWMQTSLGGFAVMSFASGISYLIGWPLETMKALAQTGTPTPNATTMERIRHMGGPIGMYRGVAPGVICGGFRNGCAFVAMIYAQKLATQLGLRDE
jgi:solute carrier family 25 (mitochondrial carnitine/acylcarnitine transporter), member 20/29